MTRECIDFVNAHKDDDTARLLLGASRYPAIDMPAAVQQIEGLRTAREKWPELLGCEEYEYPPRLNREQASSEATARYKAESGKWKAKSVVDLTGGMGIDTLAFARVADRVDYVERDASLCNLMERNLRALGMGNVSVHCADSLSWLATDNRRHDLLFIDPARRDTVGRKVAAFDDCTPNILGHLDLLRERGCRLMVKASPMIDIDLGCRQLGAVGEVHVVAVKGECKEVLFILGSPATEPQIVCVDLKDIKDLKDPNVFSFRRSEEAAAPSCLCQALGAWLYEPGAELMKASPYRLLGQRYGVQMLAPNTHLYTSGTQVAGFPGRTFRVVQEMKLDRREAARLVPDGRAHVVTRNYPVAAEALQRQLGLKEGGELFVVATTVGQRRTGLLCEAVG
ncbi:MAG: THUMP-like domain-containing protein [bacterium]